VTSPKKRIHLLSIDPEDYSPETLQGVLSYVEAHGLPWELRVNMMGSIFDSPFVSVQAEDGLIAFSPDHHFTLYVQDYDCPVVVIRAEGIGEVTGVEVDHADLGRQAARHFQRQGYETLLFFEAGDQRYSSPQRDGFLEVCPQAHLFLQGKRQQAAKTWILKDQLADLADTLAALPGPIGICCPDVGHAARALQAAKLAGLAVPEEAGLIVLSNDSKLCELMDCPLSQLTWSEYQLGWEAAALLHRLFRDAPEEPVQLKVPHDDLIIRESSSYWVSESPYLQRVHHVLKEDWSLSRNFPELEKRVHTSRRTLDRHSMQYFGMTLNAHMERLRVEKTCLKLKTENMPLAELALEMGYPSQSYMTAAIRKATGKTPGQLRGG